MLYMSDYIEGDEIVLIAFADSGASTTRSLFQSTVVGQAFSPHIGIACFLFNEGMENFFRL
jgi:hypothetical protein